MRDGPSFWDVPNSSRIGTDWVRGWLVSYHYLLHAGTIRVMRRSPLQKTIGFLCTLTLGALLSGCSVSIVSTGTSSTKRPGGESAARPGSTTVSFRPVIVAGGALAARDAFISASDPVPDVETALANAATSISQAISLSYPDVAAAWPGLAQEFLDLDCYSFVDQPPLISDDSSAPLVTCDADGIAKYILGPAEVAGSSITSATASKASDTDPQWLVNLTLDEDGTQALESMTSRLAELPSRASLDADSANQKLEPLLLGGSSALTQMAITHNSIVLSAPQVQNTLSDGKIMISGSFTSQQAKDLAGQLAG